MGRGRGECGGFGEIRGRNGCLGAGGEGVGRRGLGVRMAGVSGVVRWEGGRGAVWVEMLGVVVVEGCWGDWV